MRTFFAARFIAPSLMFLAFLLVLPSAFGADPPAAKTADKTPPDTILFTNGDKISGKFIREVGGHVMFHSDVLGDVTVTWDKIQELHTQSRLVVLQEGIPTRGIHSLTVPQSGTLAVANQQITVHPKDSAALAPIPVKKAQYILDETTLQKQIGGHPGFLGGWNGNLTAGATIVQATQEQYTFSGGVSLARVVPTVSWLNPHNRTTADFNGSFGKIIQPAYVADGVVTPSSSSKSSIYHADAERDEYFSARFFALGQVAFDHNFGQNLDLQQIYGGGIGLTALKRPQQELDLKTTLQYEKQTFIDAAPGEDQNLIGSTVNGTYALKLPRSVIFKQEISYIPAYNNPYAYSANEANTLTMPFFKNLSFSVGTNDSYLNDPPEATPPTKRNSLQFTTGIVYLLKSKY
ncbi:DUF481 domain-containing protein [Paracidobacterium acidisoli]|uniref:DUF481 domain-containing protein n=1 Tax=Paracidobacterium acidisoli TaxID=2303751 RepID=UPI001314B1FF|nr:DUF481 domain-containing protein [Paracidobacterium acidisoli]